MSEPTEGRPKIGTPMPSHLEVSAASDAMGPLVRVTAVRVREGWQIIVEEGDENGTDPKKTTLVEESTSLHSIGSIVIETLSRELRS